MTRGRNHIAWLMYKTSDQQLCLWMQTISPQALQLHFLYSDSKKLFIPYFLISLRFSIRLLLQLFIYSPNFTAWEHITFIAISRCQIFSLITFDYYTGTLTVFLLNPGTITSTTGTAMSLKSGTKCTIKSTCGNENTLHFHNRILLSSSTKFAKDGNFPCTEL